MLAKEGPSFGARSKRLKFRLGMVLAGLCVIAVCLFARYYWGAESASADPVAVPEPAAERQSPVSGQGQRTATAQAASRDIAPKVVATVNNEPITREELGNECLRHHGKQVLEGLVNKYLIAEECRKRNIVITEADVSQEIQRMATKFGLPVDHWLKMLKQERGINAAQYASDIIWPTLALRRLAGDQLQITAQELNEEYERQYGPAVKARIIVLGERRAAESVRAAALANPADFGNLAKEKSTDVSSASMKGLIPPIHRHIGDKQIEQVAFQLQDGQVSEVIPLADQFVILKRECLLPASNMTFEQARGRLEELIRDKKMRRTAHDIFRQLQQHAQVQNVYNDPALRAQMPGIAATINGRQIALAELAEMCIQRHGEQVLEGTINRRLLEQACKRQNITITEADLDAEIARAAAVSVRPKPDGSPDVEAWLKLVTEQQNVSVEVYRRDAVWPSVALKKLAGSSVQVSEEDLQKSYEANYGPRVRCRAIVLNNLRRAQEVWEKARQNPTADHFGDLAEKYSIEPGSQALRGEVPPIQRHGGQPLLEKDAFALQPGELSGIIDAGSGRYVILFCEGRTTPVQVEFAAVRDLLFQDVHEKKQRVAMANHFERIQESATIDNYLAGTTRSPAKKADLLHQPATARQREASRLR